MNLSDNLIELKQGKTSYCFLLTGDIFEFNHNGIMLNGFHGNPKDGSPNNIYLRIYKENSVIVHPLLGIRSHSILKKGNNSLLYTGKAGDVSYEIVFYAVEGLWFWDITLNGKGETVDLLYGQDIGVASRGGVLTNELYAAQYLGHSVFETENGYTICSRQNQDQGGVFPYLRQGSLGVKVIHYSTDGMQFFKTSYKDTDTPAALTENLPDINYQFEFSYTALQTEKFRLDTVKRTAFYGLARDNHPKAINFLEFEDEINIAYEALKEEEYITCPAVILKADFGTAYSSPALRKEDIFTLFPERILEEYDNDTLLSFFTKDHSHIVTKEKELRTERPHGTIFISCPGALTEDTASGTFTDTQGVIASTAYMYGLFNGQTVLGNTSFHKLLSTSRGLLNIQKNCGQHLYVKLKDSYRLLTLPALFEMGMNYARWYYVLEDDLLRVSSYTAAHKPFNILEVTSLKDKKYDFILTNQLVLGENEHTKDITYTELPGGLRFTHISKEYPDLYYDMLFTDADWQASDDRIFFEDGLSRDNSFLTITLKETGDFKCIIAGSLTGEETKNSLIFDFEEEKAAALKYYRQLNKGFELHTDNQEQSTRIDILNQTAWWYTHNAMIHFASPHGLEQPGGAAWGTRDVCQGPMEYFLMTQNYELAGKVLLNIFSHQYHSTGEWSQWFMFDRYAMDAGECHGDVVFWPLKCIGDYLEASGDYGLLKKEIPYTDEKNLKDTLLLHIKRAFEAIMERFIGDTGLITYAGGDWDDTLQPVDPKMREHLVSSWTVALAYQTLRRLGMALKDTDKEFSEKLTERSEKIAEDFKSLLIKDSIIPGFALYDNKEIKYMLHPVDTETGIQYRLLPMTRSIIAELVSPEQAKCNMQTIKDNLKFPDGVHLMNRPARYNGGVSKLFKRAEQAANVGREISLLYIHAHIRYLEACAKIGDGNTAWDSLFTINPILIQRSVPTACLRQSNMYFSSSDGSFTDRYDFAENFDKLKSGELPVKAGWRLYSSGPGIYLNQLISNILGIRFLPDSLIIDPVLSDSLDGLKLTFHCFDKELLFCYHLNKNSEEGHESHTGRIAVNIDGTPVSGESLLNPYREGGLKIDKELLKNVSNQIDIFVRLP
ncbi:GH36-type glycosyl hydrolase domain-containing protein [Anaerocolumna xylanovorans]|uniref:Cellobiose phosphorylase n=1 Tax=Anaerocolumna xylanovorans DSM 12503 TaxID=1121345 RepID=A0A1M7XYW4_9FIRM|nr:hypothetical protein [Anaerocolumna xylanovorans]SHO44310.1 Cellobiose phosphorylase [Anaerocolumna xylanovorans DSM 12503]